MRGSLRAAGFTLIELVVVIVLSGIIAVLVGRNIARPIEAFTDTARRAALVDEAETALNRVTREVRLALPNSVRLSGGQAVEFLRTRTGGRYRAQIDPGGGSDPLDFTLATDTFDVLGAVREFGQICAGDLPNCGGATATSTAACMNGGAVDCLVVYNTGQPADCATLAAGRTNAYCGDNVAGVKNVDVAGRSLEFVHDVATGFPFPSPNQRFHIVDTPVSFICNLGTGTLTRYSGYSIGPQQPTVVLPPAVTGRTLADNVVACNITYDPGTLTRAALVTMSITLADPSAPAERVRLFQQVHVPNVP